MTALVNILVATSAVGVISLTGIFALSLKEKTLHYLLLFLIAFSAGTILGAVFFDLIPEAVEIVDETFVFIYISIGYIAFFVLERFIYWYHGHGHESDIHKTMESTSPKRLALLNLIGDGIHNFTDGMIIAASFTANFLVGLTATIAVIFHELPQEMGDYGILLFAGFKRTTALLLNFVVALLVVLGGFSAVFFIQTVEPLSGLLISFSAGGFIYLGASELIPELHKEKNLRRSAIQFIIFILGILLLYSLGILFHE